MQSHSCEPVELSLATKQSCDEAPNYIMAPATRNSPFAVSRTEEVKSSPFWSMCVAQIVWPEESSFMTITLQKPPKFSFFDFPIRMKFPSLVSFTVPTPSSCASPISRDHSTLPVELIFTTITSLQAPIMTALMRTPPSEVISRFTTQQLSELLRTLDHTTSPTVPIFVTSRAQVVVPYPWIVEAKNASPEGLYFAQVESSSYSFPQYLRKEEVAESALLLVLLAISWAVKKEVRRRVDRSKAIAFINLRIKLNRSPHLGQCLLLIRAQIRFIRTWPFSKCILLASFSRVLGMTKDRNLHLIRDQFIVPKKNQFKKWNLGDSWSSRKSSSRKNSNSRPPSKPVRTSSPSLRLPRLRPPSPKAPRPSPSSNAISRRQDAPHSSSRRKQKRPGRSLSLPRKPECCSDSRPCSLTSKTTPSCSKQELVQKQSRVEKFKSKKKSSSLDEEQRSLVSKNERLGVLNAVGEDISATGRHIAFQLASQEERMKSTDSKLRRMNTGSLKEAERLLTGIGRMRVRNSVILGMLVGFLLAFFLYMKFFKL